jgi:ribosomal RNA-processing protein 9
MPDAFFSQPKPRKRKRDASSSSSARPAKSPRNSTLSKSRKANGAGPSTANGKLAPKKKKALDEELSEAGSSDPGLGMGAVDDMDLRASDVEETSGEEDEAETPAEKRLRLAKMYLEGVRKEAEEEAAVGWDAGEIDRDIIGERLKRDVEEGKGRMHLYLADEVRLFLFDLNMARSAFLPAWGWTLDLLGHELIFEHRSTFLPSGHIKPVNITLP